MLNVSNINKHLGSFRLRDISFDLPAGYIMGLIGPNGAGKSTLLQMIMGLYEPESGNILVAGNDVTEKEHEVKNDIGYVLSEDLFLESLSLIENANMYGKYYERYDKEKFLSYCERFGLSVNQKLGKHSKGEKLKFQFAFALSHDPKLLLLDEPTASFDPEFRKDFLKIITEFVQDEKHSVILATHLTKELDRVADYITFINHGELVFSSDREQMESTYRMVSGEDYKINLLPKERIIYKEKGKYGSKALVKHNKLTQYGDGLDVQLPSIEDIMYYVVKGEKEC